MEDLHMSGGPMNITNVDWQNPDHQRIVLASLVKGVYVQELDRRSGREGAQALAPRWWESFNFSLNNPILDPESSSIFGAIYQLQCPRPPPAAPTHVVAFRGTITKLMIFLQDFKLDVMLLGGCHERAPRFEVAMQKVREFVSERGDDGFRIWLAGHSLGASNALYAGRKMAEDGYPLMAFLFNPPFVSPWIGTVHSVTSAFLSIFNGRSTESHPFDRLSRWCPRMFVHPEDIVSQGFIKYFKHGDRMNKFRLSRVEGRARRNTIRDRGSDGSDPPMHLLPSADLVINRNNQKDKLEAHGLRQWWMLQLPLEVKSHRLEQIRNVGRDDDASP